MHAVKPSAIVGYQPGRYSWDLHGLLRSGRVTLDQVLAAFQYDYDPVLKVHRRAPAAVAVRPAQTPFCKGR
jgi:hypothetical protein